MIIKEGSIINIIDGLDDNNPIVEKIVSQEDINIDGNGKGYTFILRCEGNEENSIFVADEIIKKGNEYIVKGYFKDAILVAWDKHEAYMYNSYLEFD